MNLQKIKTNLFIIIILVSIIGGYVFFLLSPRIFSEPKDNLLYTPLSTSITINQFHSMSVEEWQYCEKDHQMEIIISFDARSTNPSEKYVYRVINRNKAKEQKEIDYDVTYQSSKFATLLIKNVPNDFNEMAVNVGYIDKHAEDAMLSSDSYDSNDVKAVYTTVFTNKYMVTMTDSIEQMNVIELYIGKIERENENLQSQIDGLLGENENLKIQQTDILERVAELRNSEIYVTEKEKASIQENISSYQTTYDGCQISIDNNNAKISDYEDNIASNSDKITELRKMKLEANK